MAEAARGAPLEILHVAHERCAPLPHGSRLLHRTQLGTRQLRELIDELASVAGLDHPRHGDACFRSQPEDDAAAILSPLLRRHPAQQREAAGLEVLGLGPRPRAGPRPVLGVETFATTPSRPISFVGANNASPSPTRDSDVHQWGPNRSRPSRRRRLSE